MEYGVRTLLPPGIYARSAGGGEAAAYAATATLCRGVPLRLWLSTHFLPTTSYGIDGTDDTTASCAESTATRPHGTHEHRLSSAARSEAPHTRSPPHHTCSHKLIHGCTWLRSAPLPSVLLTTAHTEARANCHSAQSTTTGSHPSGTRFARRAEWGVERLLTSDVASP